MPRVQPYYCNTRACPERGAPVDVPEAWSAGAWWPMRDVTCHHCGALLDSTRDEHSESHYLGRDA